MPEFGRKPGSDGALPFDPGRAHRLYKLFLGPAEKAISGKHLLIVPSQSLMQFPFATLVTEQPTSDTKLRDVKSLQRKRRFRFCPQFRACGRSGAHRGRPKQASHFWDLAIRCLTETLRPRDWPVRSRHARASHCGSRSQRRDHFAP